MIDLEVCLASDNLVTLKKNLQRLNETNTQRIELCSAMHLDGLTPSPEAIELACKLLNERIDIMVMIRPRGGDFTYASDEIAQMFEDISIAAKLGASGVVLGALTAEKKLDLHSLKVMIEHAKSLRLCVTFHRAFDALLDPVSAISTLIDLGVERVLTSGVRWEKEGGAEQGIEQISRTLEVAKGEVEIIIGGGVTAANIKNIFSALRHIKNIQEKCSIHTYSAVLKDDLVQQTLIADLKHQVSKSMNQ